MRDLDNRIRRVLDELAAGHRLRRLRPAEPMAGGRVRLGGRILVNFSSNDYLGLSHHPLLIERARDWTARYGAGSGASRLVTGHLDALERIEARIAASKGTQAALVFASGWQCNASVLPALLDKGLWGEAPVLLTDRLNHASLHAGCRIAGIRQIRFRHNDLGHLGELLADHAGRPTVVVTETVFSMDGDMPDLPALAALVAAHDAVLYVDEAHATGVMGRDGFGLSPGLGIDLAMGTFSKALGGFGAYVACSAAMRDYLVNRASGLIYATAPPPAVLGAIDAALDLVPSLAAERRRLADAATYLRGRWREAGLDCGDSASQIVPVILGSEARVLAAARTLEDRGLLGVAIRPPTVPEGTARIRFALSVSHTDADIEALAAAVMEVAR
jgi:8-amino-7-oxononanoate synthase